MANIALCSGLDMARALTGCDVAIVTAGTAAGDRRMVYSGYRRPGAGQVAGFTAGAG